MSSARSYSSTDSSYLDVEQGDSNEVIDTGSHKVGDMESRNNGGASSLVGRGGIRRAFDYRDWKNMLSFEEHTSSPELF